MKLLIFTDNHFCKTASILRKFGSKYTTRLENQILSLNWLEKLAVERNCQAVICGGDFFDKSNLQDIELTALRDIEWNSLPHYFVVGNHESSENGLVMNSAKALEDVNRFIISEPTTWKFGNDTEDICFLPYVVESDRKPVVEYFGPNPGKRIIFSHNDISGLNFGGLISKTGFGVQDLESNADLIINGHLHNHYKITSKLMNLGNLTGKDFGEDAAKYPHYVMLLDTDTLAYELIENPLALNFYKLEINTAADLKVLTTLKNNAVVSIKCRDTFLKELRDLLLTNTNIIDSRVIITKDLSNLSSEADMTEFSTDHITKFIECAREKYGNDVILEMELLEVCK